MPRYDNDDEENHIDMRPLLRLTVWGTCALVAVGATVVAGRSEVGAARAKVAIAMLRAAPSDAIHRPSNMLANRPMAPDENEQRLAEQVRALTADRDRLAERVATLEHNLNDVTGSIARLPAVNANNGASHGVSNNPASTDSAANPAPPPQEKAGAATPAVTAPQLLPIRVAAANDDRAVSAPAAAQPGVGLPAAVPLPRPAPLATILSYVNSTSPLRAVAPHSRLASVNAARSSPQNAVSNFAIDLGSATNVDTLRAHWGAVKAAHGGMLAGLQPLVSVRRSTRPGFTEFHLVAGPVTDTETVARLCAALISVRVPCHPSTFTGHRLDQP
jgi:hypothetical protein